MLYIISLLFRDGCCVFRKVFGWCALQMLVEICIFNGFCAKKLKKEEKAWNLAKKRVSTSVLLQIPKPWWEVLFPEIKTFSVLSAAHGLSYFEVKEGLIFPSLLQILLHKNNNRNIRILWKHNICMSLQWVSLLVSLRLGKPFPHLSIVRAHHTTREARKQIFIFPPLIVL